MVELANPSTARTVKPRAIEARVGGMADEPNIRARSGATRRSMPRARPEGGSVRTATLHRAGGCHR